MKVKNPRKVFISVLGAGIYEKCSYVVENFKSSETTFIQQATMELLNCKDWTTESHAYILLTDKAREYNWNVANGERYDNRKKTIIPYQGLHDILANMNLPFHIDGVAIPEGKDKDEMWQIFEKVYSLTDWKENIEQNLQDLGVDKAFLNLIAKE